MQLQIHGKFWSGMKSVTAEQNNSNIYRFNTFVKVA